MYFCQFSELDADTYVGHRRLLCRGGAGPHGVIWYFPVSGPAPWAAGIISSGCQDSISWASLVLVLFECPQKKYLCILEASNKNKNFKQFRKKFCYEPWAPLVMQLNDIMVARIWFSIMHVFMAMIPESLLYRLYMNIHAKKIHIFLFFSDYFRFFSFYRKSIKRTAFFLILTLFWLQVPDIHTSRS